jgi:uncharacterized RDD family membrane protein YckC
VRENQARMAYGMQPQGDPTEVLGRRVVAYIIDFILFAGILIAVMVATRDHSYTGAPAGACRTLRDGGFSGVCAQFGHRVYTWKGGHAAFGYLLAALLGLLNLVLLQGITGASVGKQIMGLRVVNAQGAPCGIGRAFVRTLLLIVDNFFCFLVGLLVAALTHPHRRVGDMVAGTYVVALADVGRPAEAPPQQPYPYAYSQAGPPGWAPPGVAPPPAPGWGTTPPPAPGWGTAAPPAPGWGTAPPPAPGWGAPPPPPPSTWGAPPPPTQPPPWGAPAPTPPPPAPTPPTPTPTPAPAAEPASPPPPPSPPATPPATEGESWWSNAIRDEDDESEK